MLKRSKDRKTANKVTKARDPKKTQAAIANAFGLPAGSEQSCPGATIFCNKICYAGTMERLPYLKSLREVLESNFNQLKNASLVEMIDLLDYMLIEFEKECVKKNAPKHFRIHWDGDFFNQTYAQAWAIVIKAHKSVQFWVYTRSMFALPILSNIDNLSLYASADPVNLEIVKKLAPMYGANIAYVDVSFDNGYEALSDSDKVYRCPEGDRLDLIGPKGSACERCGVCINQRGDVLFSTAV